MVKNQHKKLLEDLKEDRNITPENLIKITNVLENYKNVVNNLIIKKDLWQ